MQSGFCGAAAVVSVYMMSYMCISSNLRGGFSFKAIHVVNTAAVLLLLGEYVFISEEQMGAAQ
jgi:hypothetical protein